MNNFESPKEAMLPLFLSPERKYSLAKPKFLFCNSSKPFSMDLCPKTENES
jgi:hypothetical protein